jgi:hypothetical protein
LYIVDSSQAKISPTVTFSRYFANLCNTITIAFLIINAFQYLVGNSWMYGLKSSTNFKKVEYFIQKSRIHYLFHTFIYIISIIIHCNSLMQYLGKIHHSHGKCRIVPFCPKFLTYALPKLSIILDTLYHHSRNHNY